MGTQTIVSRGLFALIAGLLTASLLHAADGPASPKPGDEPQPLCEISTEANAVHRSGIVFDGHNDLAWQLRKQTNGSFDAMDIARFQPKMHTDIPRLRMGGLNAQFWSVYVPSDTMLTGDSLLRTLEQIQIVNEMVRRYPETFELASTADDVERIVAAGKIASLMGVEGGHSIQNSLSILKHFSQSGVRYMTLTHSKNVDWCDSCTDMPKVGGLSPFGVEVVHEMNRLGMLVDISHVSVEAMNDVLDVTKAPVIFSHSSCKALCDHPRNVPDDVLRRLAKNRGVIMINFFPKFLVATDSDGNLKERCDLSTVVNHIEHAIKIAGIDHVGLGGDYDGIGKVPEGLEDVRSYPCITQELLKRGHSPEDVKKVLGGNTLRVMREAEQAVARVGSSVR